MNIDVIWDEWHKQGHDWHYLCSVTQRIARIGSAGRSKGYSLYIDGARHKRSRSFEDIKRTGEAIVKQPLPVNEPQEPTDD